MVVSVYPYNGREDRIRHYSDTEKMLRQKETGNLFSDAIDIYPARYTYEEADVTITEYEMENRPNAGDE